MGVPFWGLKGLMYSDPLKRRLFCCNVSAGWPALAEIRKHEKMKRVNNLNENINKEVRYYFSTYPSIGC